MSTEQTEDEKLEVKSVSSKTFAFGVVAIILVALVCSACLVLGLFSMSERYITQLEVSASRQDTILTLTRALDRAEGKLAVYEAFLTDRQEDIVEKLISRYLKKERTNSGNVTLEAFQRWVGIGGT